MTDPFAMLLTRVKIAELFMFESLRECNKARAERDGARNLGAWLRADNRLNLAEGNYFRDLEYRRAIQAEGENLR